MNHRIICLIALGALSFGCKNEPERPPPAPAAPAAPAASSPLVPAAPATVRPEVPTAPTEEDFEQDATKSITSKNLTQELDRLERELSKP